MPARERQREPHGASRAELMQGIALVLQASPMVHPSVEVLPTAKALSKLIPQKRTIEEIDCYLELLSTYGCESRREARALTEDFFANSHKAISLGIIDPLRVMRLDSPSSLQKVRPLRSQELRVLGIALRSYAGEGRKTA